MAKVKVEVLDAVVGGHRKGDVISVDEHVAKRLEANYYVKRVAASKAETKTDDDKKDSGK